MELVSKAADSIAEGDIVERSKQNLIVCYGSGYNILLLGLGFLINLKKKKKKWKKLYSLIKL